MNAGIASSPLQHLWRRLCLEIAHLPRTKTKLGGTNRGQTNLSPSPELRNQGKVARGQIRLSPVCAGGAQRRLRSTSLYFHQTPCPPSCLPGGGLCTRFRKYEYGCSRTLQSRLCMSLPADARTVWQRYARQLH